MKNGKTEQEGYKEWWLNGERHREDGPAFEDSNGSKQWYINGERHREDGPAVEHSSGRKEWYLNGLRHRENGPAVEYPDGDKFWWINNEQLTEEEFNQWKVKNDLKEKLEHNLINKLPEKRLKL